jgi:hypothetical protein
MALKKVKDILDIPLFHSSCVSEKTDFPNVITATVGEEWNVPAGSASSGLAKLLYRLSGPRRWWQGSISRIVVQEIGGFPLRILAALRTPHLRFGYTLLSHSENHSMEKLNFLEQSKYVRTCRNDMQRLQENHQWVGLLDLQIAAQAHRAGASWAIDNFCKRNDNTV